MKGEITEKINNVENEILLKELRYLQAKYMELSLSYDKCQNRLSAFAGEQEEKVNFIIKYLFNESFSDARRHKNSVWKFIKSKLFLKKLFPGIAGKWKMNFVRMVLMRQKIIIWECFTKFLSSIDIKIAAEAAWHAWLCKRSFKM